MRHSAAATRRAFAAQALREARRDLARARAAIAKVRKARAERLRALRLMTRAARETLREQTRKLRERYQRERERILEEAARELAVASTEVERRRARLSELAAVKAHERERPGARQESDAEVLANIPARLRPVFEAVGRKVRGGIRISRSEAFLQWAEEHPEEVDAILSEHLHAGERELERQLAREQRRYYQEQRRAAASEVPF